MSNLIDRQAAIKVASKRCHELRGVFGEIEEGLKELPTVDAIPIEWLLKERDKNKNIVEKLGKEDLDIDFVAKYGYDRASHKALMIEELLLDWRNWEKENGLS